MASNTSDNVKFVLGIDIGTTSIKASLLDLSTGNLHKVISRQTKSSIRSDVGSLGNEQDVDKIIKALHVCVSNIVKTDLQRVVLVGISGQMHGVVLWKSDHGWSQNNAGRFSPDQVSQLYTWQDGRCTAEFLASLPSPQSHLKLATGHGCATIFWLCQNRKDTFNEYDCAGTIQDYVVAMLCSLSHPRMSVHNAASWGYYSTVERCWNKNILQEADFPTKVLPEVLEPGEIAGYMQCNWYGIPQGTPIGVALGDLQCSILSRLSLSTDAVLNISTSAQLAFQMADDFVPEKSVATATVEYFPYFSGHYLAVAASLTGGNVLAAFVRMLQQWTHELGFGIPEATIWEKLHAQQQPSQDVVNSHLSSDLDDLVITPTIYGERHCPDSRGSAGNIHSQNISLASVYHSLCRGLVSNLHSMMSASVLRAAGISRIIGSGTVMTKNAAIRREVERLYNMTLVMSEQSEADAAFGAAMAMRSAYLSQSNADNSS